MPNPSEVAIADTWHGPYKVLGNPHYDDNSNTSFHSQISCVFKVPDKKDLYVACADRWLPDKMDMPYEKYRDEFDLMFGDTLTDEERARLLDKIHSEEKDDNAGNTSIADYVWLPLRFEEPNEKYPDGMVFIDWKDEWSLDEYE